MLGIKFSVNLLQTVFNIHESNISPTLFNFHTSCWYQLGRIPAKVFSSASLLLLSILTLESILPCKELQLLVTQTFPADFAFPKQTTTFESRPASSIKVHSKINENERWCSLTWLMISLRTPPVISLSWHNSSNVRFSFPSLEAMALIAGLAGHTRATTNDLEESP